MCQFVLVTLDLLSLVVKANAIIAYNNKSATEAVPYFEQVSNEIIALYFLGVYGCFSEVHLLAFVLCNCLTNGLTIFLILCISVLIMKRAYKKSKVLQPMGKVFYLKSLASVMVSKCVTLELVFL